MNAILEEGLTCALLLRLDARFSRLVDSDCKQERDPFRYRSRSYTLELPNTEENMIEVAALLLCKLGGKGGSADDIKAVLEAAGVDANEDAITKLTGDLDGKDVDELLGAGMEKLKDVPMGGGGGGGGGG